tara:strand:- start:1012 stop:2010 length:999 start_codon:yes stop_codon:yes gene_type:complete
MRIIFEKGKQRLFLEDLMFLLEKRNVNQFAKSLNLPPTTVKNWIYEVRHLPQHFFDFYISRYPSLNSYKQFVQEKRSSSWGQRLGGKKSYKAQQKKYGVNFFVERQSSGGKKSRRYKEDLVVDIYNKNFLEFYGALLGDGWLSKQWNKKEKKFSWTLWFSGHLFDDEEYLLRIEMFAFALFGRTGSIKIKPKTNCREFSFGHKKLVKFFNSYLRFPIGKKIALKVPEELFQEWDCFKFIIRGLFDTDGSLYFDLDPRYRNPYPILEISTSFETLREQLSEVLKSRNFRVIKYKCGIRLKGESQLLRWFEEIKPQNKKHILKYENFLLRCKDL